MMADMIIGSLEVPRLSKNKKLILDKIFYDPIGQAFFAHDDKGNEVHVLDMRGAGFFKDEEKQDACADEIVKRIRMYGELVEVMSEAVENYRWNGYQGIAGDVLKKITDLLEKEEDK